MGVGMFENDEVLGQYRDTVEGKRRQRESASGSRFGFLSGCSVRVRQVQPVCGVIGVSFPASLKPKFSAGQGREGVNDTFPTCKRQKPSGVSESARACLKDARRRRELGSPVRVCKLGPRRRRPSLTARRTAVAGQPPTPPIHPLPRPVAAPSEAPSVAVWGADCPRVGHQEFPALVACPATGVKGRHVLAIARVLFIHAFHPAGLLRMLLFSVTYCVHDRMSPIHGLKGRALLG